MDTTPTTPSLPVTYGFVIPSARGGTILAGWGASPKAARQDAAQSFPSRVLRDGGVRPFTRAEWESPEVARMRRGE